MAVSVREILDLPVLRAAGATVVAGHAHVHHGIRWVQVSEELDVASSLKGGELLLTTGLALGHDTFVHDRYVRKLSEVPVAGLAIGLGEGFSRLPESLGQACERFGVPLLVVPKRVSWIEVALQIHEAIISSQLNTIRVSSQMSRELTNLLLSGSDLSSVLACVARMAENPVVVADRGRRMIDMGTHVTDERTVVDLWRLHLAHSHGHVDYGEIGETHSSPRCVWSPIWYRGERTGSIHILECDHPLGERAMMVLSQAVGPTALSLWHHGLIETPRVHANARLLHDLVAGKYLTANALVQRAQAHGIRLEGESLRLLAFAAQAERTQASGGSSRQKRKRDVPYADPDKLLAAADLVLASEKVSGICGMLDRYLIVVILANDTVFERPTIQRFAEVLAQRLKPLFERQDCVVGISSALDISSAPRALRQAEQALRHALHGSSGNEVAFFEDLGPLRLLLQLRRDPEVDDFVKDHLRSLLSSDGGRAEVMLQTLRAYLEHNAHRSETALALHIDRRTLYERLERLENLLSCNLEDGETCHRIWLALRASEAEERDA